MDKTIRQWLNTEQTQILASLCETHIQTNIEELQELAKKHLATARQKHDENGFVNIAMAEGIFEVLSTIHSEWSQFTDAQQEAFKGAFAYFFADDDEVTDFDSPIGFEDDLEVLNACLRFANRTDLILNPEDFDDA